MSVVSWKGRETHRQIELKSNPKSFLTENISYTWISEYWYSTSWFCLCAERFKEQFRYCDHHGIVSNCVPTHHNDAVYVHACTWVASVTVQKRCDHQSKGCSGQQGFTLDQESMQLQKRRRTSLATSGIFDTDAVQSLLLTDRIFLSHCVSKKQITTTTYWPYDNKMKLTCRPCNHYIQWGKESSMKNRCWPLSRAVHFFLYSL